MPPKGKRRGNARGRSKSEALSDNEEELPPPPPPRPFKEIEGLPLSTEEPSYSILNNALSIKDTAVLYSSLMRSRKSYTNGNIFDLYWAKGKTKFDNDVNARDRMNKFCDCSINLGPHAFDVRFFILKDDEVEKRRQDEKDKKKEKRMASKKLREEKQRLKELKIKAKQEGLDPNNVINPNPNQPIASPNTAPVVSQTPTSELGQSTTSDTIPKDPIEDNELNADDSKVDDDQEDEEESDDNDSDSNEEQSREASAQPVSKENTAVDATPEVDPKTDPKEGAINEDTNAETSTEKKTDEIEKSGTPKENTPLEPPKVPEPPQDRPLPPLQVQPQANSSTAQANQAPPVQQQPIQQPLQPQAQQPAPPPPQPSQNDIMQTPESQMMIANLNIIARMDPSLNSLMKIVATGNAKPEQIREFQAYIQRAKAMGPSPNYYRQPFPNAPMTQNTPPAPKPPKKPKAPKKPKPPKEKQLTTFQEMYVDGADLVFEFNENPNIRYNMPKDAIIEKLENGDIIVSFFVIHNSAEIRKWKNKQEAKKARLEKKEQERKEQEEKAKEDAAKEEVKKEEEADTEEKGEKTPEKRLRRTRKSSDRGKEIEEEKEKEKEALTAAEQAAKIKEQKEKERLEKEAKELDEPEPIPYFSAMSFTLTNISKRYLQIFHNSFNKAEDVKEKMEKIMKEGVRVPKYYLWYSVDAYEDENLAESLREALYLIENPPKGKNRKRALEENPIIGNITNKKVKKET